MFVAVRAAAPRRRWTSTSLEVGCRVVAGCVGTSRGRGAVGAVVAAGAADVVATGDGAGDAAEAELGAGLGAGTVGEAPFCAGAVAAAAEGSVVGAVSLAGAVDVGSVDVGEVDVGQLDAEDFIPSPRLDWVCPFGVSDGW
jgi:hypothetical protein